MNRILVIRGAAIGDFVLTLPAIKLLRDRFPKAHIEILGYKHIAALAEERFYVDAVRSIESASLARFFAKDSDPPAELLDYFARFDLILSYLHDPDRIFETNAKKLGSAKFVVGPSKLDHSEHAAFQLARPLAALGLFLTNPSAHLFPTDVDRDAIRSLQGNMAFHPGSGSESKNWPIENWIELGNVLLARDHSLIIVAGESDTARTRQLKRAWDGKLVSFAENLPLTQLAALLEGRAFIGHDSGISHIAAAVGAPCLLLFGPTAPAIWAPGNANVTVLRAPEGKMELLDVETVAAALWAARGLT